MQRVTNAIETAGMKVFARLDHDEAARHVGLVMPPTVVLLCGPRAKPRGIDVLGQV
jgi:uncharacterized protein (DUF302 family)